MDHIPLFAELDKGLLLPLIIIFHAEVSDDMGGGEQDAINKPDMGHLDQIVNKSHVLCMLIFFSLCN